jgi:two-component system cell cycle response regulator DivK
VEDNPDSRLLVRRVLEAEDYRVIEAGEALVGIEIAKTQRPDLILMDICLPGMDGLEATTRLREIKGFESIPILAVTAYVLKDDREKALQAGCSGYIKKPIDVDRLPAEIASFLQQ